ncbi:MAG: filamentous hemagglutinin N-terminal domain-containing protein [Xenococcaceae cyanobacterium MO_188.B32]|nr:filamentous hemagglutinin N-terminal domain-containing protein [Xenococcaceae cyanobacterium MO_188.B32]
MKPSISLVSSLTFCLVGSSLQFSPAIAQIAPDGTTNTTVNADGNNFTINQGDRVGDNLFHSFDEFSVPTMGSAAFNNANDIANIFSRVTGSNISNIDGLISANGTANLFLINPNGIIFGENARLNLGGSFFATTADSLLFEDDIEFSASNPQAPPLLEVNIPIGLGFRDNSGNILNQSTAVDSNENSVGLQIQPGGNLTFVGGKITLDGGIITAPGGRVELGGLAAAGTVNIKENGSLTFPDGVARADVSLSDSALVDVANQGGGFINVNARNLDLLGGSRLVGGIAAGLDATGNPAGDINLNATTITIDGTDAQGDYSAILNRVNSNAVGNAGGIDITTGNLNLTNGGTVSASTFGRGNAGRVDITASDTITIDGETSDGFPSGATSRVEPEAVGDAGGVTITTGSLSLTNGGLVSASTLGQGNAGRVDITASDTITIDGETSDGFPSGATSLVNPEAVGNAGGVTITTGSLSLTNGGLVSASTLGQGNAGNLMINARSVSLADGARLNAETYTQGDAGNLTLNTDSLFVIDTIGAGTWISTTTYGAVPDSGDGGDMIINARDFISLQGNGDADFFTGIFAGPWIGATGQGGKITITTGSLFVTNSAEISTFTLGEGNAGNLFVQARDLVEVTGADSFLSAEVLSGATGRGGDLRIETEQLNVRDQAQVTVKTVGSMRAGNLTIETGQLLVRDGAQISASTSGEGDAGTIAIAADTLTATGGGTIQTNTASSGRAGDITLNIRDSLNLTASAIEASTAPGSTGDGGNIFIDPIQVNLTDGANISVNSQGEGNGGSIFLTADNLTLNNNSEISAATASGEGGNITFSISDTLRLRNNSPISATAGGTGNGGNITIDTDFLIASDNSDITADAFEGQGGNIDITALGIFLSPDSEITASSQLGVDGIVEINTPENDPSRGLVDLPENVVNPEDLISQNACKQGGTSKFTLTGRGGLPATPEQIHHSDEVEVGLVEPAMGVAAISKESPVSEDSTKIVPAKGWIRNEQGEVFLVGYDPTKSNISPQPENLDLCQPR